ncbi:hypothetical protein D9757_003568 [Collybiopsis confluens]|uniref:DUF4140 domain-containing protein n=1 Tax=Collybiopsis confluens TaxID=2823264 RepID=A0A8H5MDH1_9AGAR|nr:hypothetical protein D9757_003568 [Collybiopsis confluens]
MATLPPYAANTISLVSTTHSKLLHVSVYTGRAELQRLFKFNVKTGQNQLQITGLPIVIQAESLRVQGHGNATIHDVSISSMPPKIPTKHTSPLIQDLQTKKKAVQNAISRHKTSSRALDNYIRSMTVHDVPFSQVEALMGTYDSQASKIEEELVKLRKEEDALDEEIAVEHARIVKDQGEADGGSGAYLGMQVSIGLFAENEGEIELELVYAVTHANWYALYDLRVNLEAKDNP